MLTHLGHRRRGERAEDAAGAAAACCVGAAAVLVPLVFSRQTPYALDLKYVFSGALALLAGLALLLRQLLGGRVPARTAAMLRVLGLFLCAVMLSLVQAQYFHAGLRETWYYLAHAVLFAAAAITFRRGDRAQRLVTAALVIATVVAVYGCLQHYGIDPLVKGGWFKGGKKMDTGRSARILGTIGLETALGGYMAACAVLALGAAFAFRGRSARLAAAAAVLPMGACMFWSGTRTAWLAFAAGGLTLFWFADPWAAWRTRWDKAVLATAALVMLTLAVWFGPTAYRRVRLIPNHLPTRTTIWRSGLGMFFASPVVGQGPGAFRICFPTFRPADYAWRRVGSITLRAHNEYLEVLSETGLLGMVPFAIFIGLLVLGSGQALGSSGWRPLLPAAFGSAVALLVHAVASVDTRYPTCQMMLWVMMGLTVALWEPSGRGAVPARRRPSRAWPLVMLLAGGLALVIWTTQVLRPFQARQCLHLANAHQKAQRWDRSIAAARQAVRLDPISVPSHYTLANSLFYAGRYQAALEAFRTLRRYQPDYCDIHLRIAMIEARLGRMERARQALARARRFGVAWGQYYQAHRLTDEKLRALAADYEQADRP